MTTVPLGEEIVHGRLGDTDYLGLPSVAISQACSQALSGLAAEIIEEVGGVGGVRG
jgi:hypothetical protein